MGSFERNKCMFKLIGKKIITILCTKYCLISETNNKLQKFPMKALAAMLHDSVDSTMLFVKIANVCVIQATSFIMVMIV